VIEAMALAGHLLLFAPSLSGVTPIERFARQHRPDADTLGRVALEALAKASFRLLRLEARISPAGLRAKDIASGESLNLFDAGTPDAALGVTIAARIAPLPDGAVVTFGPVTPLNAHALAEARSFVREGRGLSNPQRCAAAIYKHVVRHGGLRIEGLNALPRELLEEIEFVENEDAFDELDDLAFSLEKRKKAGQDMSPQETSEARRLTSFDRLIDALTRSVLSRRHGRDVLAEIFEQIAFLMLETYARRAAVGAGGEADALQTISAAVDRGVAEKRLEDEARTLYQNLRRRVMLSGSGGGKGEKDAELARVLARIRGLRAKTVEQGCSEQEALASAKKVAELLDRYGLSLGEVEMRQQACEGVGVDTGRKRRAPLDDCVPTIAAFCDCKVWSEGNAQGAIRYVFFGLPLDVEAAHYLYDLIAVTFTTETARYKAEDQNFLTSARRDGARSFQIGLAHGIIEKLATMKSEREAAMRRSSGRDLVVLKRSVIDEELEKLGLDFHAKPINRKRRVASDAYRAGREMGRRFEPRRGVSDRPAG